MNRVYKYFLKKYVMAQKLYFALVCVTTVLQSVLTMCIPLTYRELLDKVFPEKDFRRFVLMIAVMLTCYFLAAFLNVIKDFLLARVAENITMDLRMELNQKISMMKYSYFDEHSLNGILSKYSKEIETIKENCGYMLVKSLSNMVTFIMAASMIIGMEWKIMCVSVILLLLYVLNNKYWGKKVQLLAEKSMESNEATIGVLTENYKNVLITKLYSAYKYVNEKFEQVYRKQYKTQMALEVTYSINLNAGGLINYLLSGAIWFIGGIGIFAGRLTIGTVTALINYQSMLVGPLTFFSEFNNSYQGTIIAMKRLLSVLMYEEEDDEGHDIANEHIEQIVFSDVAFKYSRSANILENINICLNKGKVYAFIGGSGCGKSSLVKLLLGLYYPASGYIYVNKHKMQELSIESLRNKIAFVAQDSLFYQGTIRENLSMGREIDQSIMVEYSKLIDVYDEIDRLPMRWDTELNSATSNLSGGQKKRLDVLRALLKDADIIVFDESTASIDLERRKKLFEVLNKIKDDKIIICITHNLDECSHFDKIFGVRDKKVYQVPANKLSEAY